MEKCGQQEKTSIKSSNECHLYWKKDFNKNPIYYRFIAVFEADNEIDISTIGEEQTKIFGQNPVLNGYYIKSELNDVFESGHYESPLG